jgi:Flp pilus assembly protein TadD
MKIWKSFFTLGSLFLLGGCATELMSPTYEDHPNLKAAEMARARGDIPQAIHNYRDIIKQDQNCEKAYVGLGNALLDGNSVDEAKKTFDKALGLFPKSVGSYNGLGNLYLVIDQPENALAAYEQALKLDPRNAKAWNGHGIALDMLNDHESAQANYRAAMELSQNNPSYEANLALSMALSGCATEAIHILERLARDPNATPRVRQNLALAYGLAGDTKMAKKIGRVDLSEDMVRNNLNYFEAVQQTQDYTGLIPKNHTTSLDESRKWQKN